MNWIINNMWWGVYLVTMVWFICLWTILRFSLRTLWELFVKQGRRGDCFKKFLNKDHAIKILGLLILSLILSVQFSTYISVFYSYLYEFK